MNIKKIISKKPKFFNVVKLLGSYAVQPFFLLVHLTLSCNGKCRFCYQHDNEFYNSKGGLIKTEDFERIISQAKRFFIKPLIHFFGGEPLINPYFKEIIKLTDNYHFNSSITTNGFLLEGNLDVILNSRLKLINISLDDIGEKHDLIKGLPGCFAAVIENIKKLAKSKKIININCVISEGNYGHLIDLAGYFRHNKIDISGLFFQHSYFTNEKAAEKFNVKILAEQLNLLANFKANFPIYFTPNIKLNDLEKFYSLQMTKYFKNTCNIPWLGLNILPNLEVTPGGGVLGCNQVVGDLKKETMREIWNNDKLKMFRKKIIEEGLMANCSRCCHRQYY